MATASLPKWRTKKSRDVRVRDRISRHAISRPTSGFWHIVNDKGFYVAGLFEPEPMSVAWPEKFEVGTCLDRTPPGQGSEDFGGSIIRADDGELYAMFGKTAFINAKIAELKTAKAIPGGKIDVTPADVATANGFREQLQSGKLAAFTCDFEPQGQGRLWRHVRRHGASCLQVQQGDGHRLRRSGRAQAPAEQLGRDRVLAGITVVAK